jgi:hypothetical protein
VRGAHLLRHAARRRLPNFEALALTAQQIDLSGRVVVYESLKKRRRGQPVNTIAEADFFVG